MELIFAVLIASQVLILVIILLFLVLKINNMYSELNRAKWRIDHLTRIKNELTDELEQLKEEQEEY